MVLRAIDLTNISAENKHEYSHIALRDIFHVKQNKHTFTSETDLDIIMVYHVNNSFVSMTKIRFWMKTVHDKLDNQVIINTLTDVLSIWRVCFLS